MIISAIVAGFLLLIVGKAFAVQQIVVATNWRVVDGDTIHITDTATHAKYKIRLIGIDAPELNQQCTTRDGREWPCGQIVRDILAAFLQAKENGMECVLDGLDRYRRHLGTCYAGTVAAGINVQQLLVRAGLAVSEYDPAYQADEMLASQHKLGLWKGRFMRPKDWRRQKRAK